MSQTVSEQPQWIVVSDTDGVMHHVCWSVQNERGWFMVYHYPDKWRAQSQADEFNRIGKKPWEFREWRP